MYSLFLLLLSLFIAANSEVPFQVTQKCYTIKSRGLSYELRVSALVSVKVSDCYQKSECQHTELLLKETDVDIKTSYTHENGDIGIKFNTDGNKLSLESSYRFGPKGDQFEFDQFQLSFQGVNDSKKTVFDPKTVPIIVKKDRKQKLLNFQSDLISYNNKKLVVILNSLIMTVSDYNSEEYDQYYEDFSKERILDYRCEPESVDNQTVDLITPGIILPDPAVVTVHKTPVVSSYVSIVPDIIIILDINTSSTKPLISVSQTLPAQNTTTVSVVEHKKPGFGKLRIILVVATLLVLLVLFTLGIIFGYKYRSQ